MQVAGRPWWLRASIDRVSTSQNNIAAYVGPFSLNWDHEFSPWDPKRGFVSKAQPRRTFRVWFDGFGVSSRPLVQIKLWRDTGHYCECGVLRDFCDVGIRHHQKLARAAA